MDARQFRNTFAILHNLDKQELEDASVLIPDANGGSDWSRFTNGIGTFVLKLPTDRLEKLYALIDGRQPDKYRGVPPLTFGYTNWRGKFEQRTVRPRKVWSGKSRNDVAHVVVCCNDEIVHDPTIDQSGIVAPTDDGFVHVEFLIPAQILKEGAS
ncbi:hypothetical protein [Pelagibacterium lentulum]|uniref:Uncharacterized protein n=1 Tax=Pelagibacterium lentulum TaxID=2029865 RepID=A0A916RG23_9HYPH|nr:hypothetical protein [Pelagibacterium lentulum]GGA55147.1 hypothetical protein GCM10011499_26650 [Pelagibacterium lentulum]